MIIRIVSSLRSVKARAVTISDTNKPAPCSRQSNRKAELVMPAIGASTTGTVRSKPPPRMGR